MILLLFKWKVSFYLPVSYPSQRFVAGRSLKPSKALYASKSKTHWLEGGLPFQKQWKKKKKNSQNTGWTEIHHRHPLGLARSLPRPDSKSCIKALESPHRLSFLRFPKKNVGRFLLVLQYFSHGFVGSWELLVGSSELLEVRSFGCSETFRGSRDDQEFGSENRRHCCSALDHFERVPVTMKPFCRQDQRSQMRLSFEDAWMHTTNPKASLWNL